MEKSEIKAGSSVALYLKTSLALVVAPGTVTVGVPYLLLRSSVGRFEIGMVSVLGMGLIVPGATALLWCFWDFVRFGRGTPAPIDPPKTLVQRGLYRFVRNPMYVGVLAILLGEVLLFQSWALLGWAIFMGTAFHLFIVLYEEPALRQKFGKNYEEYFRSVPRWIPRLRDSS